MKPLIKRFQVLVNVGLLQQHRSAVFVNQKHQITNGCSVLMTPIVELDDENKLKCSIVPIGELLNDAGTSDFQVVVANQGEMQTIPVHKAIIRKFSKRIDRILANPESEENATNQIVIENFTFDVVSKSLDVAYSRTFLSFKNGEEINYNMLDMLNLYWFFKEYEMIDIDLICNWIESNISG
uniref:BTB domain-containing protein n=1 Tax=Panagrolaimus sp. JU765 TaxID=591449 RepID=A0AC34RAB8_9BILA